MTEVKKIYVGVCFDDLTLDPGMVKGQALNRLATSHDLIGRDGKKFLSLNFKSGDLVEIKEGVYMLDRMMNVIKPG